MNRKGVFFFVVDVLIAVLIFIATVVVLATFFTPRSSIGAVQQYVEVSQQDLFRTTVGDAPTEVWTAIPQSERVYSELLLDQMIYRLQSDPAAGNIVGNISLQIPVQFGVRYVLDGATIYERESVRGSDTDSRVKLTRKKVTVLPRNRCPSVNCPPVVSEVQVWS